MLKSFGVLKCAHTQIKMFILKWVRVSRFQGDANVKGGRGRYHDGRYGATRVGGTRTSSLIRRGGADGGFCIPFG
jgi:hypothetical protein